MKPGPGDVKLNFLIAGDELHELERFTIGMAEAFGLDRRIESYSGKRLIGFYRWDLDCLWVMINFARNDESAYPDKTSSGTAGLKRLQGRLEADFRNAWG